MRFEEMIRQKRADLLGEAPNVGGNMLTQPPAQPAATNAANAATQQVNAQQVNAQQATTQQAGQQEAPEALIARAFQQLPKDGAKAAQMMNAAVKNMKDRTAVDNIFTNIGYDPSQGFIFNQQTGQMEQPASPQHTGTPGQAGATATNTQGTPAAATTSAANIPR